MDLYININGKLIPAAEGGVRADNRALRYGYGLFETMLVCEGVIRLASYHWERLMKGMTALGINKPKYFGEELDREVLRTVQRNKLEGSCRVRLQVSAGNGGLYDGDGFSGQYLIEVFPLEPHISEFNEAGLVIGIGDSIKHTGKYSWIKSCSALPYALAAREAKEMKWNDALLLNEHGNIVESTIANVFWTMDGTIYTPPLAEGCIDGIMRRHLLSLFPAIGYDIKVAPFKASYLAQAATIFLSNAVRGIKWVRTVDDREFEPTLAKELHTKLVGSL